MENVDPGEDDDCMVVLDDGDSESGSYTETEDMTTTQDEDEDEAREGLMLEEVVRQMPENMELDLCPAGSNRMQYVHRVAWAVDAMVKDVNEDSDESIDLNWLDDDVIMNTKEKHDTRKKGFTRLVKEAVKQPKWNSRPRTHAPTRIVEVTETAPTAAVKVTEKDLVPSVNVAEQVPTPLVEVTEQVPTPLVEVTEKVPVPSLNVVEQVPIPSVEVAEEAPAPSVNVTEKVPASPVKVVEKVFFMGRPTSSNVKTDALSEGVVPNSCFPVPLQNQFCISDIPKPRLFNPRTVCTLLRQDCITLNTGPPINQLRVLTPSWMQQ